MESKPSTILAETRHPPAARQAGPVPGRGSRELAGLVETHFRELQGQLPQIKLKRETFLDKVTQVLSKQRVRAYSGQRNQPGDPTVDALLARLKWEDLYLATACAAGDEAAWQIFQSRYQRVIRSAARYCATNASEGMELAETLFTDLFLPTSSREGRKISQYHGMGSLESWIRVVISRLAIDQIRKGRREVSLEDLNDPEPAAIGSSGLNSPDHQIDQRQAATWFTASFKDAILELKGQEKLILNLYYVQGLNLKEIAKMLRAHESTASRTLDRIRRQIRKSIEKTLRDDYHVRVAEIPQVIEMARREVDIDITPLGG